MLRRPPRATRTTHSFPTRRSSDLCSSGGIRLRKGQNLVSRNPGFQVPFAEQIKRETGMPTIAVGMILEPKQAENIMLQDQADLIALGREMLFNPNWEIGRAHV